jgi:uncharacterized damage-inducible protein DinB
MKTIAKPAKGTYPEYYERYISLVNGEKIFEELYNQHIETMELITSVDEETLQYRYAEGKWNIREMLQHLIDSERIFAHRALRIARGEELPQHGFDDEKFVKESKAASRDINDMIRELSVVRAASVELFKSFDEEMLNRMGNANGKDVSVRSLVYILLGHEIHHRNIIEEKYLPK